jgi:NADH-quinone oxidoreductase subunit N
MTIEMLLAIAPQLTLSFGLVLGLLMIAWQRSQLNIQMLSQAILIAALVLNFSLFTSETMQVTHLLKVDHYSAFAFMLISLSSLVVVSLSRRLLNSTIEVHDEYYLLVLLVTLGASILVVSDHYASLFLGFELLSIALVGLVGYVRSSELAVETGFKYLILSATASSFMLLGIAFIYSQTGQLNFALVATQPNIDIILNSQFYSMGILLFFAGVAFKLSLFPFHSWTPDVYQGSPTPITLLMATVSKVAMFVVLMKTWFAMSLSGSIEYDNLSQLISIVAVLSMIAGNALALFQTNIKRLLGYSSIAHMGYLLIIMQISSLESIDLAWHSALFYLTAYVVANLSIFTVLIVHSSAEEKNLDRWKGMFWQNKPLAMLAIIAILSLAGIPLTMGFIGKFYLLTFATQAKLWWLIAALIIGSGIGLFYYLRLMFTLFDNHSVSGSEKQGLSKQSDLNFSTQLLVFILMFSGVFFGLFPDVISQWVVM